MCDVCVALWRGVNRQDLGAYRHAIHVQLLLKDGVFFCVQDLALRLDDHFGLEFTAAFFVGLVGLVDLALLGLEFVIHGVVPVRR